MSSTSRSYICNVSSPCLPKCELNKDNNEHNKVGRGKAHEASTLYKKQETEGGSGGVDFPRKRTPTGCVRKLSAYKHTHKYNVTDSTGYI